MLIHNAQLISGQLVDVRIACQRVASVTPASSAKACREATLDAGGATLLPGLHDHHLHFLALAAARESTECGPPAVRCEEALITALRASADGNPSRWVRGVGYHQSVAGDIDRYWLDSAVPDAPVRIQHRSGRLWIFNSRALDLLAGDDTPLERVNGVPSGRLYDGDSWLRVSLGAELPDIAATSRHLASRGVTGFTDATPRNGPDEYGIFHAARRRGDLLQDVLLMGSAALEPLCEGDGLQLGARKLHLLESSLPDFADICAEIRRCHARHRGVAFHCASLAELAFAAGALVEAGAIAADRIEHASVAPPDMVQLLATLGVTVVTQPNFIFERGDQYLLDVDPRDRDWLYRLAGFRSAGVPLAAGTDAPFGDPDPWRAMAAAVNRRTPGGAVIGAAEALSPKESVGLFLGSPEAPGGRRRAVTVGAAADLCLLDRPWREASDSLADVEIRTTIKSGRVIWER